MTSCWEWKNKYGNVRLGNSIVPATLLAWFMYKDIHTPLTGQICHFCNYRRCVNPEHLYHATGSENMKYAAYCGRITGQKINKKIVNEIRKLKTNKTPVSQISLKYDISTSLVYKILEGIRWQEN